MYIEKMNVNNFRHIQDISFGPFHDPTSSSELIILAGPNGSGKSSVLELLSFGLAHRYSWQYYQSRTITEHSFSIKIGLNTSEISNILEGVTDQAIIDFLHNENGYWINVNPPEAIDADRLRINESVHGLVSRRYQNFTRKLGFFLRSDRVYAKREYNQRALFNWKQKLEPSYFNQISYGDTSIQYTDMYDFLLEQSYHYTYALGQYTRDIERGEQTERPADPLLPYNELLGQLFPGYSFADVESANLSLCVKLPTGNIIPFQDLSSGEKEVFFILSFFIRHNISYSTIVIDEPDLHLHSELARKLIRLMRNIRPGNQIWCATHNAELIDEAGRERTYFLRPSEDRSRIECFPATQEGAEISILRDIFGYSGYVGISRKIVFSEGTESSADRKTFANLSPSPSDNIKIIPVGTVSNLYRINKAVFALLQSDFTRCEFYLIRDRDYMSDALVDNHRSTASQNFYILSRYHIENYLLNEEIIADILNTTFQRATSREEIYNQLLNIARRNSAAFLRDMTVYRYGELYQQEDFSLGNHSNGLSLLTNNSIPINDDVVSPLKDALLSRLATINSEVSERISTKTGEAIFQECLEQVTNALKDGSDQWKSLFPGRFILQRFSSQYGLGDWPSLQNLIIERLATGNFPINTELQQIFNEIQQ